MTPAVSAIVPNWNGANLLKTLLPALWKQCGIAELIVVDNGSTDESVAVAELAGARMIQFPANRGFAAAVNAGVSVAVADWVLIVNTDVELTPGWVAAMVEGIEARSAWFGTGKLLDARRRGILDGTFDAVCRGGTAWRCGAGQQDGGNWDGPRQVQFIPLTAAVIRKELFSRVGPLDESFESYLEDVDFGFRCAGRGFYGVYVPGAVGFHLGSATLGRWHPETVRRIARNQLLLIAKHYPGGWAWRFGWPVLVAQVLWGCLALRHGAGLAWLRGKGEGLRQFRRARTPGPPGMADVLRQSEEEVRRLQGENGFDLYWRLYFALT